MKCKGGLNLDFIEVRWVIYRYDRMRRQWMTSGFWLDSLEEQNVLKFRCKLQVVLYLPDAATL